MALNVLVIEDSPGDVALIREELARLGDCSIEVVNYLSQAKDRLSKGEYDIVVVDCGLPDSEGFETVDRIKLCCNGTQIYVYTGMETNGMFARRCLAHRAIAVRKSCPSSLAMVIGSTYRDRTTEQRAAHAHLDQLRALLSDCSDSTAV